MHGKHGFHPNLPLTEISAIQWKPKRIVLVHWVVASSSLWTESELYLRLEENLTGTDIPYDRFIEKNPTIQTMASAP
jgi:hypothetical protein